LDASDVMDIGDVKNYRSLIGWLQLEISLGRWDIATAAMTMSKYRSEKHDKGIWKGSSALLDTFQKWNMQLSSSVLGYSGVPSPFMNGRCLCMVKALKNHLRIALHL